MKNKILEILNKYNGIETWYDFTDTKEKAFENLASPENIASEIESLIKENYYPREFVKWLTDNPSHQGMIERGYQYWLNNIKDK